MKKLLPVLLLLLSFGTRGQDYSCFQPDTIQYYTNDQGYVRAIRIDSVHSVGGDIIYYPFKTPRGYYENIPFPGNPLDSNGGSWVGGKIIQQLNGITLFDNYWGDTVTINTQADLGDEWTFYQHFSSQYSYKAQVTSKEMMSFLGYTDSVKTITISAYDGVNINPADSMNGFEIKLSKSHGFVQAFDMYMFPYHPHDSAFQYGRDYYMDNLLQSGSPGPATSIFRRADYRFKGAHYQYNWNVGDIYQYSQCNYNCWQVYPMNHLYLDTINQVYYSGDTAKYISSGWRMGVSYFPYNLNYTFHQNDDMIYPGIILPVYSSYMPEEKHQRYRWYFYPNDVSFCSNAYKYRFYENNIDDDMHIHLFEAGHFTIDYKQDLGLVYYYIFHGGGVIEESERKLIFRKSNGTTCGTFIPVNVPEQASVDGKVKVYPNPAADELIVDGPAIEYHISVIDVLGREVLSKQNCAPKQSVDVSLLPDGIYSLKLHIKDQTAINTKVLIRH